MRRFTNRDAIIAALKDSELVNIAGDEGEEVIVRKNPLPIQEVINASADRKNGDANAGSAVKQVFDRTMDRSMYAVCCVDL